MFKFHCPHCQQRLSAEAAQSGATLQCPACGVDFVTPPPTDEVVIQPQSPEDSAEATSFLELQPEQSRQPESDPEPGASHSFAERLRDGNKAAQEGAKFVKQGAMVGWAGLKRRSKQAALKAQIEKLRNIDLRKALHSLGKKAFEQGVVTDGVAEQFQAIRDLDARIAEMRDKAAADAGETKMEALKRVSKDTAKASQAQALTVKREHLITELGREIHVRKAQISTQEFSEESTAIATIEHIIRDKEDEMRGLNNGGKSGIQTLAVAAVIGLLVIAGALFGNNLLSKKDKQEASTRSGSIAAQPSTTFPEGKDENPSKGNRSSMPYKPTRDSSRSPHEKSQSFTGKESYDNADDLESDIERIREKIGNFISFIVVQKLDRDNFQELGARGELYEINVPSESGTVPPSRAILITTQTTFSSTGESSMWVLSRKAVEITMQSGFTKETYVVEESPKSLVKEWYRLVDLQSKFSQTEQKEKSLDYLKKKALDYLQLPNIYVSSDLQQRNFSVKLDSSEQDKLIKLAKNQEWSLLLKALGYNESDSPSMSWIEDALKSLSRLQLTAKIKSSSTKIESSFPAGSVARVNIGYIVIPPPSTKILSVSDRGIEQDAYIQNINEEIKSNEGSVQLDFWGSSVYFYEITGGSSAYRHRIYSENYQSISEEVEKANKLFKSGSLSKSELEDLARRLEISIRGSFVDKFLKNY